MATDEQHAGDPPVVAEDLMKATEGNDIETQSGVEPASDTSEVPPLDEENTATAAEREAVTADQADAASPTGGANIAGTPQSQLDLAPPMVDESGSNIPYPNLQQPVADTPTAPSVTPDSQDPALVDPDKAAVARVEGRTSDAASRAEGTHIDEVPSDINAGNKPSDGGPEAYPFPQGGDVEVATIPESSGEGEFWPALTVEDAVILGEHELVPERLLGRRAFVIDAPRYLVPVGQEDDVWITVRTRDEVNATLTIPLAACTIERGGRSPVVRG